MSSRAKASFPFVVASVLALASLLTTPASAQAAPSRTETSLQQRKSGSVSRHGHGRPVHVAARSRRPAGPALHRAHSHERVTAFLDDNVQPRDGQSIETGLASWYGGKAWHGNRMANGERYDDNSLTAAHASLPIGSKVRVQLVGSERAVVVTITDRPGTRSRIIDLSRGAAKELGILARGVAPVTLTPL